jgi:hypothetical protein
MIPILAHFKAFDDSVPLIRTSFRSQEDEYVTKKFLFFLAYEVCLRGEEDRGG